jgi:protein-tyrosine phosphatase
MAGTPVSVYSRDAKPRQRSVGSPFQRHRCYVAKAVPLIRSTAAALLVFSLTAPHWALAGERQASGSEQADLSAIGVGNLACVNPNYFRGAAPSNDAYTRLAAFGIRTIIDLRSDDADADAQALVERLGMKYVAFPMTTHQPPTASTVAQFLQIVDARENQPVYVHCVGGRHRTGLMTALYRMAHDGWKADRAFREMKQYKFGPDFLHPEFKRFLFAYRPPVFAAATPTN